MLPFSTIPVFTSLSVAAHKLINLSRKMVGSMSVRNAFAIGLCVIATMALAQTRTATSTAISVTSGGTATNSVTTSSVVTLTANVSAGGAAVKLGQVNFCDAAAKNCTDVHLLGTMQLTSAGTASLKLRPGIGSHSYKSVFIGTNTLAGSSSSASALAVTGTPGKLASKTTIAETGSWGNYTLTGTVTEFGGTVSPSGMVSFKNTSDGNVALASVNLGTATGGIGWLNPTSLASIGGARTALVGDFNGDGIPDLAINENPVVIYLGNAGGTYTQAPMPPISWPTAGPMIIADFNGDGIQDLAVALYGSDNISILLGNGDGTFATPVEATIPGTNPEVGQLITADFNGDGIPDLAVIDQNAGTVDILLGNGDGTFTPEATNPPITSIASYIVAGDFNGDGKTDLAVAESAGLIAIFQGNGDGTFAAAGTVNSGASGSPIAAADFNGDGKLDLAVAVVVGASGTSDSVTIFTGNGDGTFNAPSPSQNPVSSGVSSIQVADFNQDGAADLILTDDNGNFTVFLNDGTGAFSKSFLAFTVSTPANLSVGIGDFNGDGYPDILPASYYQNGLPILVTEPTETATASASVSVATVGQNLVEAGYAGDSNYIANVSGTIPLWGIPPTTITTLAVTAGGKAVTSVVPSTVVTLTATVKEGTNPLKAGQVVFCDASGTDCTDIHLLSMAALTSAGTATYKFVPGPGSHSYKAVYVESGYGLSSSSAAATLTVGPAPSPMYSDSAAISESGIPGDYSLTATVVGFGGTAPPTGSVSFVDTSFGNASLADTSLGSGTPGLGWLISQTPAAGNSVTSEVTGDFNGDGIQDLAVLWTPSTGGALPSVTIFFGKGDGAFTTGPTVQVTGAQNYPTMIGGDFNGDGKIDLAVLSWNYTSTSYVTTLLGNGDGTFTAPQTSTVFAQNSNGGDYIQGSMVAADFNGDGKMDLAVVGDYISWGGVTVLLGNGDGTFNPAGPNLDLNADFGQIATGDFNGDGVPDLVVTNYFEDGTSPIIFLGKGDGTFTEVATNFSLDYFPTSIVVGDFNGDGVLDLAFSDLNGVEIALGRGDGTFNETSASPIQVPSELHSLAAGDFNHDGKLDVAGLDNYNDRIVVLIGGGDGTFTVTATIPAVNQNSGTPSSIVAADFNGDGVPDLAMLTSYADTVSILLTEPTQTATATVHGIAPVGAGTHNVEASYAGDTNYPAAVSGTVALSAAVAPVVISPNGGSFSSVQTVTLSESIPGATIYYYASGTLNTNGYVPYTGAIALNFGGSETISAYATETGYLQSQYTSANFTLNLPTAPTPVISLAAGSYSGSQTVTISDTAANATIYYTTDGTYPTIYSPVYKGAITVSTSDTVAAIATATGYGTSATAVATYYIDSAQSPFIYTVAGNESWGYAGDGGLATIASLNNPFGVVVDSAGNIYIADSGNNLVRRVAAGTGIITTVAGSGIAGYSGDNGPATKAQMWGPSGLAVDAAGDLYITDYGNNVVRKVTAGTGTITTFAGSTTATSLGDGGPATSAQLSYPAGLALDSAGNLYIADYVRVRRVAASTGIITTFAGNGNYGYTGDKGPATSATFRELNGLAVDGLGNVFIADSSNNAIREVAVSTGVITTVAGIGPGNTGSYFGGDGGPATSAHLYEPYSVAVDATGNLFIADTFNEAIREVTASNGIINTIAGHPPFFTCTSLGGDGGPAVEAEMCSPIALSLDRAGNLYIAESVADRIREITIPIAPPTKTTATPIFNAAAGTYVGPQQVSITDATPGAEIYLTVNGVSPTTAGVGYHGVINVTGSATLQAVAVAPGYLPSAPVTAAYTITTPPTAIMSTVAGNGQNGASGIGGPATRASFSYPTGVALDSAGNLYIADSNNNVVWKVASGTGTITVAAGTIGIFGGNTGNGGPATSATLSGPTRVAVDSAGNLYIADTYNSEIREVSAQTGIISAFAGGGYYSANLGDGGPATSAILGTPQGISFDSSGNLYIADVGDARIRMVSATSGTISTVAGGGTSGSLGDGGQAIAASLNLPVDVVVGSQGNIYIADSDPARIRMVNRSTGVITTIAGDGDTGDSGDGGPATAAEVYPGGLALDAAGNLYISNSNEVRLVPAGGGAITMVAGNGYIGFAGDGGSATLAGLCVPQGLAFDKAGSLYIADGCNYRVRKVTFPGAADSPSFTPAAGTYTGAQSVTIKDGTENAAIYYTTDGSTPTTGSNAYSGAITVSSTETVKAIAVAAGFTESPVASAAYIITQPVAPVITWATPAPITYGTALSSAQLDATTTVAGSFVYSPAAGTVLNTGSQTLKVTFTPTDTTGYTTSTATVTLTVNTAKPVLSAIGSSLNPSLTSNSVTFTASVSAGAGTPTGSVAFFDGTAQLGTGTVSSGSASYATSSLAAGTHSITAVYSGDQNLLSVTSTALAQVVESYSIGTASDGSSSATASAGGQASYALVVTPPSVGEALKLSVSGLPAGATGTFSPSSVAAGGSATNVTLTVNLPSSAAVVPAESPFKPGALPILFGLILLPFVGRLRKASQRRLLVIILVITGLAVSAGLSACGGGNSGGTGPVSQNYTLTVTASSGSLQQSTTLTLTVK